MNLYFIKCQSCWTNNTPYGKKDWLEFNIGQKVTYLGYYKKKVKFEYCGKIFVASENCVVSEEQWLNLRHHFGTR